jgi:hypothetical protein
MKRSSIGIAHSSNRHSGICNVVRAALHMRIRCSSTECKKSAIELLNLARIVSCCFALCVRSTCQSLTVCQLCRSDLRSRIASWIGILRARGQDVSKRHSEFLIQASTSNCASISFAFARMSCSSSFGICLESRSYRMLYVTLYGIASSSASGVAGVSGSLCSSSSASSTGTGASSQTIDSASGVALLSILRLL